MPYLFILICLVILILVVFMFLILKNTVSKINNQTKTYFVDKLQEYDYLIDEKEVRLKEINEEIKNKGLKIENNNLDNKNDIEFDNNIIDLFSSTDYQEDDIFELSKKINNGFVINYEDLIKDFITKIVDNNEYEFCLNLRNKFDSDKIYELKLILAEELDEYLHMFLSESEYKIYIAYKKITDLKSIDGFISYLDELVDLNNPYLKIYVGSNNENYDHLSKYVKTIVTNDIYKGIKIVYRNKVYDFSLNERNV